MITTVAHHYDDAADVRRSVSAIAFRHRGGVLGSLSIGDRGGSALYFLDTESIDEFITGLRTLKADMAALAATAETEAAA